MAEAKALFRKHVTQLCSIFSRPHLDLTVIEDRQIATIIYGACIIAEAIRNEQEDVDLRVIEPHKGKDSV